MNYEFKPANTYKAGRDSGYIEGFKKGFGIARDKSVDIACDSITLALAENELSEERIQNIADSFAKFVSMAWRCPEEYEILKRKTFTKNPIEIDYGENYAVEENEGR